MDYTAKRAELVKAYNQSVATRGALDQQIQQIIGQVALIDQLIKEANVLPDTKE